MPAHTIQGLKNFVFCFWGVLVPDGCAGNSLGGVTGPAVGTNFFTVSTSILICSRGRRIYRIQPMRACEIILFSRFGFDIIDLEGDNDQLVVSGQDQFTADILG